MGFREQVGGQRGRFLGGASGKVPGLEWQFHRGEICAWRRFTGILDEF